MISVLFLLINCAFSQDPYYYIIASGNCGDANDVDLGVTCRKTNFEECKTATEYNLKFETRLTNGTLEATTDGGRPDGCTQIWAADASHFNEREDQYPATAQRSKICICTEKPYCQSHTSFDAANTCSNYAFDPSDPKAGGIEPNSNTCGIYNSESSSHGFQSCEECGLCIAPPETTSAPSTDPTLGSRFNVASCVDGEFLHDVGYNITDPCFQITARVNYVGPSFDGYAGDAILQCTTNETFVPVDTSGCHPLDCYSVNFLDDILTTISEVTESTSCGSYYCSLNNIGTSGIIQPSDESNCATEEPVVIAVNFNMTFPSIEGIDIQLSGFEDSLIEAYEITSNEIYHTINYTVYARYTHSESEYSSFVGWALQSAVSWNLKVYYYKCSVMFEGDGVYLVAISVNADTEAQNLLEHHFSLRANIISDIESRYGLSFIFSESVGIGAQVLYQIDLSSKSYYANSASSLGYYALQTVTTHDECDRSLICYRQMTMIYDFDAPIPIMAEFDPTGASILFYFDVATTRNFYELGSFSASLIFHSRDVASLGEGGVASWRSPYVLEVFLGSEATIKPLDFLMFTSGTISSSVTTNGMVGKYIIHPPRTTVAPIALVIGPAYQSIDSMYVIGSYSSGAGLEYTWSSNDTDLDACLENVPDLTIGSTNGEETCFEYGSSYKLSVIVTNRLGEVSEPREFRIPTPDPIHALINAPSELTVDPNKRLRLYAEARVNSLEVNYKVQYVWSTFPSVDLPTTDRRILDIPPGTLSAGTYIISVSVIGEGATSNSEITLIVDDVRPIPKPVLRMTVAPENIGTLDISDLFSGDLTGMTVEWGVVSCSQECEVDVGALTRIEDSGPTLDLSDFLGVDTLYRFFGFVDGEMNYREYYTTSDSSVPDLVLEMVTPDTKYVNPYDRLVFQLTVGDIDTDAMVEWSCETLDAGMTTYNDRNMFVLIVDGLLSWNSEYTFVATGDSGAWDASVTVTTLAPPTGGDVSLTSTTQQRILRGLGYYHSLDPLIYNWRTGRMPVLIGSNSPAKSISMLSGGGTYTVRTYIYNYDLVPNTHDNVVTSPSISIDVLLGYIDVIRETNDLPLLAMVVVSVDRMNGTPDQRSQLLTLLISDLYPNLDFEPDAEDTILQFLQVLRLLLSEIDDVPTTVLPDIVSILDRFKDFDLTIETVDVIIEITNYLFDPRFTDVMTYDIWSSLKTIIYEVVGKGFGNGYYPGETYNQTLTIITVVGNRIIGNDVDSINECTYGAFTYLYNHFRHFDASRFLTCVYISIPGWDGEDPIIPDPGLIDGNETRGPGDGDICAPVIVQRPTPTGVTLPQDMDSGTNERTYTFLNCSSYIEATSSWEYDECSLISVSSDYSQCACSLEGSKIMRLVTIDYTPIMVPDTETEEREIKLNNTGDFYVSWLLLLLLWICFCGFCFFCPVSDSKPLIAQHRIWSGDNQTLIENSFEGMMIGHYNSGENCLSKCCSMYTIKFANEHPCFSVCCHDSHTLLSTPVRWFLLLLHILAIMAFAAIFYGEEAWASEAVMVVEAALFMTMLVYLVSMCFRCRNSRVSNDDRFYERERKVHDRYNSFCCCCCKDDDEPSYVLASKSVKQRRKLYKEKPDLSAVPEPTQDLYYCGDRTELGHVFEYDTSKQSVRKYDPETQGYTPQGAPTPAPMNAPLPTETVTFREDITSVDSGGSRSRPGSASPFVRQQWKVGDHCQVYSKKKNKWMDGYVREFRSGKVVVEYSGRSKALMPNSTLLRPGPNSSDSTIIDRSMDKDENIEKITVVETHEEFQDFADAVKPARVSREQRRLATNLDDTFFTTETPVEITVTQTEVIEDVAPEPVAILEVKKSKHKRTESGGWHIPEEDFAEMIINMDTDTKGGNTKLITEDITVQQEYKIDAVGGAVSSGVELVEEEILTKGAVVGEVTFARKSTMDIHLEASELQTKILGTDGRVTSIFNTLGGKTVKRVHDPDGSVTTVLLDGSGHVLKIDNDPVVYSEDLSPEEIMWLNQAPKAVELFGDAIFSGRYELAMRGTQILPFNRSAFYQKRHCSHCIYWDNGSWVVAKSKNDPAFARLIADVPNPAYDSTIPWYVALEKSLVEQHEMNKEDHGVLDDDFDENMNWTRREVETYVDEQTIRGNKHHYEGFFPEITWYRSKRSITKGKKDPWIRHKTLFILSAEQTEPVYNMFKIFDQNGDKILSFEEFATLVHTIDRRYKRNEIELMFEYVDVHSYNMVDIMDLKLALMTCVAEVKELTMKECLIVLYRKASVEPGRRIFKKGIYGDSDGFERIDDTKISQTSYVKEQKCVTSADLSFCKRLCMERGYYGFFVENERAYFVDIESNQRDSKGASLYIAPNFSDWTCVEHADSQTGIYVDTMPCATDQELRACKWVCSERKYGGFVVCNDVAYLKASSPAKLTHHQVESRQNALYIAPQNSPWAVFLADNSEKISSRLVRRVDSMKKRVVFNRRELYDQLSGGPEVLYELELRENLKSFGIICSETATHLIFVDFDKEQKGFITFDQFKAKVPEDCDEEAFLKIICDILFKPVPEHSQYKTGRFGFDEFRLRSIFERFDTDDNGWIKYGEWQYFIEVLDDDDVTITQWRDLAKQLDFDPNKGMKIEDLGLLYEKKIRNLDQDWAKLQRIQDGLCVIDEIERAYIEHGGGKEILSDDRTKLIENEQERHLKQAYCIPLPLCWLLLCLLLGLASGLVLFFGNLFDEGSQYTLTESVVNSHANALALCGNLTYAFDLKDQIQYDSQLTYMDEDGSQEDSYTVAFGDDHTEEERWVVSIILALSLAWLVISPILLLIENLLYDMTCRWPKLSNRTGQSPEEYAQTKINNGESLDLTAYDLIYTPYWYLKTTEIYRNKNSTKI